MATIPWRRVNGVWLQQGSGGVTAPPGGGGVPGGVWGQVVTIAGVTYDRTGAVVARTGMLAPGTSTNDHDFAEGLAAKARVDLGFANAGNLTTFTNTDNFCLRSIGNGDDLSIRGGKYIGQITEWNGTTGAGWSGSLPDPNWHDHSCIFGARGKRKLFELMYVRDRADGISLGKADVNVMDAGDDWAIRYCALCGCGDECFEDDWKDYGTLYKNLMSGVQMVSTRPGNNTVPETTDTRNKVMVLDGNLMWRRGKRYSDLAPRGPSGTVLPVGTKGAFNFFKWQTDGGAGVTDGRYGMQCHMRNNILRNDGDPVFTTIGNDVWGTLATSGPNQRLTACSNNWLLQPFSTPDQGYPIGWPATDPIIQAGFSYLYGQAAKDRWNSEVNAWQAAHPEIVLETADKGIL